MREKRVLACLLQCSTLLSLAKKWAPAGGGLRSPERHYGVQAGRGGGSYNHRGTSHNAGWEEPHILECGPPFHSEMQGLPLPPPSPPPPFPPLVPPCLPRYSATISSFALNGHIAFACKVPIFAAVHEQGMEVVIPPGGNPSLFDLGMHFTVSVLGCLLAFHDNFSCRTRHLNMVPLLLFEFLC